MITLNNQEVVVNLTTTEIPYHSGLTLEQVCYFLDISPKAEILIGSMKFMLTTVERLNEFLNRSTFARHPLSLLTKMRKEYIDAYGYTEKTDFVYDYYMDKRSDLNACFKKYMTGKWNDSIQMILNVFMTLILNKESIHI
ncbi:hypothetical protein [Paenibacillus polymyxa]|uniref:hypothetical protein n=1 Tax=Paenibacillus polymyxa TaxID=1406 RepID=UPI0021E3D222|nr:hypothetical protein [Paenibacillus polymyxa]